ncbi:MAG: hypothetical protein SGPRY_005294 [Prymnesium sp.]
MGVSSSQPTRSEQVSEALRVLTDKAAPIGEKTAALAFVRGRILYRLTEKEKMAAIAAVSAERYPMWPRRPHDASRLADDVLADKIRGLVFGAALGDATGLATEFLTHSQVEEFYGDGFAFSPRSSKLFPDTHRLMWLPGDWTDDTDQLILLLQSLLHTGGVAEPTEFAKRLLKWREQGFGELGDESAAGLGQHTKHVISHPAFVTSPHDTATDYWTKGGRKSAANGAVMRTAITGVPFFWSREEVVSNTTSFCKVTHADPRCIASCVMVAVCVSEMLKGEPTGTPQAVDGLISRALNEAEAALSDSGDAYDTQELRHVVNGTLGQMVEELRGLKLDDPRAMGYTFKCLGSALWSLRSTASFEVTIRQVIAEGGDADTNATVAGALVGCRLGFSQLPSDWVAELEHASWLEAYAQKLLYMLQLR